MTTWFEDAKHCPVWWGMTACRVHPALPDEGMAAFLGDRDVVVELDGRKVTFWCDGAEVMLWRSEIVPDLRDPDTFRGAVARLALHLGAPEDAARVGVVFGRLDDEGVEDDDGWVDSTMMNWTLMCSTPLNVFIIEYDDLGTTDPIEALARAWKEAAT